MYILGFDIGGTKCAVITAEYDNGSISVKSKETIQTDSRRGAYETIDKLIEIADRLLEKTPDKIGISCGGPLDAKHGIILSPPNLPGWDNVEINKIMEKHYGVKTRLQNDANACAVAEWKFGAGRGLDNIVFLTFGTGLGAGLILGGRLYEGANGNAGEVGHVRLACDGPVGFGKAGSFEGFCSGGGIRRLAINAAKEAEKSGTRAEFYVSERESEITAHSVAQAARRGDAVAQKVYKTAGEYLGAGLSMLIDIINPDAIIIGSIFTRAHDLLWNACYEKIKKEALPQSSEVCRILPAELGESIGDYAAIATALLED